MQRFCWRERSEKLNWRLLSTLDVSDVVRRGDPAVLQPYALHVTFARLPASSKQTSDAWFLVRVLQLSMEYLLFMRAKDGGVLKFLIQELRQVEMERDVLLIRSHEWKARVRSSDEQVEKLHQVLQKIAKLLQIHGASPSAVATIAMLLTELVSERRAKQKRRVVREEDDDGDERDEMPRPTGPEARACAFCGKLFSSVEFLEKHLARRHCGESIEVETPVQQNMKQNIGEDRDNTEKSVAPPAPEAAMQKTVQRVERALQEHKEKLRSLVEEEAQKIKQMFEQLHAEAEISGEYRTFLLKAELRHEEAQRQLNEVYLKKQKAEEELADLKKQIQSLTSERKRMEAATNTGLPTTLPYKSGDALVAVEIKINDPQHTLEAVNAELTASRMERVKVQALHLSALRKEKELADTLAISRGVSAVVQQDQSSQTELPVMINKAVQTDEQSSSQQSMSEVVIKSCALILKDVGTDPLALSSDIPTVGFLDGMKIIDDSDSAAASPVALEPISQEPVVVEASAPEPIVPKDDERIPNYMHHIYRQDLLDIITERAQRAAIKAANNPLAPKKYSSISRHKYVRSRFQHDEQLIKKRVASCLLQLEQFARRFGVSARSAWLSENDVQIVEQALHSHLEVLPTEVLTKMAECENTANALSEEWAPIAKDAPTSTGVT